MPHARLVDEMEAMVRGLQDRIVAEIEGADGGARFLRDAWERPGGGGGVTRVLADGALLEKAGVNVSRVHGRVPPRMAARLPGDGDDFVAVGLSLVLHPRNPWVPTTHANVRLLARGTKAWFGGGADLTPYYLFEDDASHFHHELQGACERYEPGSYARFKKTCDAYFYLPHRAEHRGVGGIFFEDLGGDPWRELSFVEDVGRSFSRAYLPIVERRRALPYGERERTWQEIRRGRYVEFNLLHDRGTVFGLETGGRTESILMSLPPVVRWRYDHQPDPGSPEATLLEVIRNPRDWA
jgi:coproporphyrinogen III oxidase